MAPILAVRIFHALPRRQALVPFASGWPCILAEALKGEGGATPRRTDGRTDVGFPSAPPRGTSLGGAKFAFFLLFERGEERETSERAQAAACSRLNIHCGASGRTQCSSLQSLLASRKSWTAAALPSASVVLSATPVLHGKIIRTRNLLQPRKRMVCGVCLCLPSLAPRGFLLGPLFHYSGRERGSRSFVRSFPKCQLGWIRSFRSRVSQFSPRRHL